MPPTVRQLLFRRIHDAVQVAGDHADYRLVPCFRVANSEKFKQRPNVVLVAVGVLAAKAPHRVKLVGLEIGRASVLLVGVFVNPRASHVVLAGTERCFVKPLCFKCRNNWVLRRFGLQNIVYVIANALRGTASRRDLRCFLWPPGRGKFQLQPIHDLLWRVAFVRSPFDQAALKR